MKPNKKAYLFITLITVLSGCNMNNSISNSNGINSSQKPSPISVEKPSNSIDYYESYKNNSKTEATETRYANFFAINDFHGAIEENEEEAGIVKIGAYLKARKAQGDTVLLNSGDMWQGSIDSNYNRGKLLTDCMNEIEFDCFSIGNHEFDWDKKYINYNRERSSSSGYKTPFLASNIYNFDINTKKTLDYANYGDEFVVRLLDNGLKVGIIGGIGEDQITSILSTNVDDLTFVDPVKIVKDLSDTLRIDYGADVVVLDIHASQYDITNSDSDTGFYDNSGITEFSGRTNKHYVDAVFCAHTHQDEQGTINGIPFIQTNGYGKQISNVRLAVKPNGDVSCEYANNLSASEVTDGYNDDTLTNIVKTYKAESDEVGKEVLGNVNGGLWSSSSLPFFVAEAFGEYARQTGYEVDYAMTNNARYDVEDGVITYRDLYRALPFDNEVFVIKTTGSNLRKEINYGMKICRFDSAPLDDNKTYLIAVIDYLAVHRSKYRKYDYFNGFEMVGTLQKEGYDLYNYRDITADHIRNYGKTINYTNYTKYVNKFNTQKLNSSI